jgi:hypothetical protein
VSRTVRLVGAVTSLLIGLLVAGCSGHEAGAAAVVGDRRISIAQVQSAYTDVIPLVGQDAQFTQTSILNWLILEPYLTQEAAHEGKGISAQDAELEFGKVEGAPSDPSTAGVDVVRAILARGAIFSSDKSTEQLTQLMAGLTAQLKADGVQVNPRYGSGIDFADSSIVQSQPNWLKPAAVKPSASPTAVAP